MKDLCNLKKPVMAAEAASARKGLHIVLEILIFVVVFLVCNIAELIVMVPAQMVLLFTNQEYLSAIAVGDMEAAMEATQAILQTDALTIAMLFANVGLILVALLFCKLIQKRKMSTVGFQKSGMWKEYACGLGAGLVLFSAAVLLCVITGSLEFQGLSPEFSLGIFILFVVGFLIQGMAEEILCRGYFLVSVSRRYPLAVGIFANALLFAALHLLNEGITVLAFVNLVLFGVFASIY